MVCKNLQSVLTQECTTIRKRKGALNACLDANFVPIHGPVMSAGMAMSSCSFSTSKINAVIWCQAALILKVIT